MSIYEIAEEMTREDFLESVYIEEDCPYLYGLKDLTKEEGCEASNSPICKDCWNKAIENIKFIGNDDMLEDVEKEEFTFTEVIARIKPGEEYICTEDDYRIKSIVKDDDGIRFIYSPSTILPDSLRIPDYVEFKLKKKEPEYMTFLEAKEKGIPKHKDLGDDYLTGEYSMKAFVKEMDKKVWTIEEEC